jgi:hypothetical protein
MELRDTLKSFLEEGADWERRQTSIKGISIIRLPATKSRAASLGIEVNPVGGNGLPMKKRGLMIMNSDELGAFIAVFANEKIRDLMRSIEDVVPERKAAGKPSRPDIVQV